MKREASINLFQYWNRLREGRRAPLRTEIEPADIKALLGDTFILETDAHGEAVFRLAGTRLCALYGRELKGRPFTSLWNSRDGHLSSRLVRSVFADKSVAVLTYRGLSRTQRSLSLELLLLPLDGGQDNNRALGIVTADTKPFWLGVEPIVDCAIDTIRVVDADREPMFIKNRPGVALPQTERDASTTALESAETRRFRHLLVLPGGKVG